MSEFQIEIVRDDITKLNVDAIVNAANSQLAGGGGVDGAIHRAAGPELLQACKTLGGCPTGSAKITAAYNLPCKYVIHAVGPVWRGGMRNEDELLKGCYQASIQLAQSKNLNSIAFSNISTGIYGFPKQRAAEIAVKTVKDFIDTNKSSIKVLFVCFDEENYSIYSDLL